MFFPNNVYISLNWYIYHANYAKKCKKKILTHGSRVGVRVSAGWGNPDPTRAGCGSDPLPPLTVSY